MIETKRPHPLDEVGPIVSMSINSNNTTKMVEVEEEFYKKLIFTASQTFIHTGFNFIKSTLISRLEDAKDVQQLLVAAKEFVETREFVDKVVAEQDRLDHEVCQQDKP